MEILYPKCCPHLNSTFLLAPKITTFLDNFRVPIAGSVILIVQYELVHRGIDVSGIDATHDVSYLFITYVTQISSSADFSTTCFCFL